MLLLLLLLSSHEKNQGRRPTTPLGELAPMRQAHTALLMSDNRRPTLTDQPSAGLTYPALAFALNALYACRHGYDLLYYEMVSSSCQHTTQGVRSASYCKLPAIAHALERYDTVVFIDSDSFFVQRNLSVTALLAAYAPPAMAAPATSAGWFANDLPQLGERPNGGFHVWQRSRSAARMLRTWWHLPAGRFAVEHDFEQRSLQWGLSQLHEAVPMMGTLQLRAMADSTLSFHHAVAHVDHTKADRRLWTMAMQLIGAAIDASADKGGPTRTDERRRRLRTLQRQAQAVPAASEPPAALLSRVLHAAEGLLHSGFGVPRAAAALYSPSGVSCEGEARGRLRVLKYNATAMARSTLPASELLRARGLPLVLLPCESEQGPAPAGNQERVASGGGQGSGGIGQHPLQHWRRAEDGRLSLAANPAYCLNAGPRKAPKTPYPMLAQLEHCSARGAAAPLSTFEEVGRASLASGGMVGLRTRDTLSTLRAALRQAAIALRRGNTAAADLRGRQLHQGRRLEQGPGGSRRARKGKHGLGSRKLRQRQHGSTDAAPKRGSKPPFWQDGRLKKTADNGMYLCLGTWRGQLAAGASVVFAACEGGGLVGGGVGEGRREPRVSLEASTSEGRAPDGKAEVRIRIGSEGEALDKALCVSALPDGVSWSQ